MKLIKYVAILLFAANLSGPAVANKGGDSTCTDIYNKTLKECNDMNAICMITTSDPADFNTTMSGGDGCRSDSMISCVEKATERRESCRSNPSEVTYIPPSVM